MLNKALAALEDENDALQGVLKDSIDFNAQINNARKVPDQKLKDLIDHFNQSLFVLVNENFEFPDLLGAAYEFLIKYFADSAGKRGGQFYTPAQVVRLMVKILKPEEGMSIYDPTAGSGGMLIQSSQWVDEQGDNGRNLELYGQDSDGTVVSICKMNLILHNLPDTHHIEFGDTLTFPKNVSGGRIMQFDRVIANPPFSQNYSRNEMQHPERFKYGFASETGKKADLMFVQHMLSSLKSSGKMAVVMPHGVLFRGGKEKDIRTRMLQDNGGVIEAIISLPPKLFYGTGIPAAILVLNKNKPDALQGKVFFINADAEYGEGKNQNYLRPEDIEKIVHVFDHKLEVSQYSKLIDIGDIEREHDWNLNIRRYVDNTQPPEPEDVRAHLVGGVPKAEVADHQAQWSKFGFNPMKLFQERDARYYDFRIEVYSKETIKSIIETYPNVITTMETMRARLSNWWAEAQNDFARLALKNGEVVSEQKLQTGESHGVYLTLKGDALPDVRRTLIESLKDQLVPLGVLDEFQVAGVFVNWWDGIKYDLKTIMTNGWSPTLIPDEYIIVRYFQTEAEEIVRLEEAFNVAEMTLVEATEAAQEALEYELDEEEKLTTTLMKDQLKAGIKDSANKYESEFYEVLLKAIIDSEEASKERRKELVRLHYDLEIEIRIKKFGPEEETFEAKRLLVQAQKECSDLEALNSLDRDQKKKLNNLKRDKKALTERIVAIQRLTNKVGGIIAEVDARDLILLKHYDLITAHLQKYLNSEMSHLITTIESWWTKYKYSLDTIQYNIVSETKKQMLFLIKLGFLDNNE